MCPDGGAGGAGRAGRAGRAVALRAGFPDVSRGQLQALAPCRFGPPCLLFRPAASDGAEPRREASRAARRLRQPDNALEKRLPPWRCAAVYRPRGHPDRGVARVGLVDPGDLANQQDGRARTGRRAFSTPFFGLTETARRPAMLPAAGRVATDRCAVSHEFPNGISLKACATRRIAGLKACATT